MKPTPSAINSVYSAYLSCCHDLRRANSQQTVCRESISIWLLISIIAQGCFFFHPALPISINRALILSLICVLHCLVTGLLWYLDMWFIESRIKKNILTGLKLEKKYEWIPKFHHTVSELRDRPSFQYQKSLFYIGIFCILLLFSGVIILYLNPSEQMSSSLFSFSYEVFAIVFALLIFTFFLKKRLASGMATYETKHILSDRCHVFDDMLSTNGLTFNLYHNLTLFRNQFSSILVTYRTLALIWFVAIVSSVTFLQLSAPHHIFWNVGLCLFGVAGLWLMWSLDIHVYTTFWCAASIQEIYIEKKHAHVLRSVLSFERKQGASFGFVYLIFNSLLLTIAALFHIHEVWEQSRGWIPLIVLGYLATLLLHTFYMSGKYMRLRRAYDSLLKKSLLNSQGVL